MQLGLFIPPHFYKPFHSPKNILSNLSLSPQLSLQSDETINNTSLIRYLIFARDKSGVVQHRDITSSPQYECNHHYSLDIQMDQ